VIVPTNKIVELPLTLGNLSERQFLFVDNIGSVFALDPGGTTGWVWFNSNNDFVICGQISGRHHKELFDSVLPWYQAHELVCESFEFRQHRGEFNQDKIDLSSKEYIGVVELYSQMTGVPITYQTASVAKHFISDSKLKRLGWYDLTKGMVHARDALRHLLYYLIVVKKVREPFTNVWLEKAENNGL
jgi:hypothetical protein